MRRSPDLAWLVAAALALSAASAEAAPPDRESEGKRLYVEGSRHFDVGEYTEAIEAFARAYSLSQAPGLLFNIAQAHRLRGPAGCGDALRFYELYLEKDRAASDRVETEERIRQMRACVEDATRNATQVEAGSPAPTAATETPPRTTATLQRSLGWTGLGLGAAGAVVATIAGAMALGAKADLDSQCKGNDCPFELRSDVERYDTLRTVTTIGFVVGGVAVAGGLVLLWTAPARSPSKTVARVELWTLGTSAGLRGSFWP